MMAGKTTALVSGGAGFIGSHLVDRLVEEGYRVVVIDNLSTGKLKNLNPSAVFHHVDITDPGVTEVFKREQPELVFHLAAQTSVNRSTRDPFNDCQINVLGTVRLLEAARRCGIVKFVYSSSGGALYGDPDVNPCTEDYPIAPVSPYGLSKYQGELELQLYSRLYRLRYTSLRYGNVYGPRQDPMGEAGVVAIFSQAMLGKNQPLIFGDGEQSRDFVYVDDVVEANMRAIHRGDGMALNIGTGEGTTINSVYDLLQDITGYHWPAERRPARAGDVYQIFLDSSKAAREAGWAPQVSLAEGLAKTVESMSQTTRPAVTGIHKRTGRSA